MKVLTVVGFGVAMMGVGAFIGFITDDGVSANAAKEDSNVITLAKDDAGLMASRNTARDTFDDFWARVTAPEADSYEAVSIKVGISYHGGSEHLWMSGCESADAQSFACIVSNEPVNVALKLGERYTFDRDAISDWMYRKDGLIHGGYTVRALLPSMPEDQATAVRAMLAPLPG